LREAASGLAFLHKRGVCVGDISPKNLLFSLVPHPGVYFIDCDAMRIHGTSVQAQVETPGWQVPAGEELATIYTDTYKLGLLALRLLAGDHDATNAAHLPGTTPNLLRQIINDTLTKPPGNRPLPDAWNYVLGNAIEVAQHQWKTAAQEPAGPTPLTPPAPVLHSRPPGAQSKPPSKPSPSSTPVAPAWTPRAPNASPPGASKTPLLIGIGVGIVGFITLIVSVVALSNRNQSPAGSSGGYTTPSTAASAYAEPTSSANPTTTTSTWSPPKQCSASSISTRGRYLRIHMP
jgi:eukaryotic-like serine/threonine-protein kinase